jgi:hypothetical protein
LCFGGRIEASADLTDQIQDESFDARYQLELAMKYLKIHTLDRGQWYDRDTILLHAAFQILADFMEGERPGEIINWESDPLHSNAWRELTQLYRWWKEERPNRRNPLDDVPHPPEEEYVFTEDRQLIFPDREKYPEYYEAMRQSTDLEAEWLEEDQRQLHRLIDVRPFMWT